MKTKSVHTEIEHGFLIALPSVPYFVYERDKHFSSDKEYYRVVVDKLKREGLYKKSLLYAGIRGVDLYKRGTFGLRKKTYAISQKGFRKSISNNWIYRNYINSPFLHMDVSGKSVPALAVFESSKLVGGEFFGEEDHKIRRHSRTAWWTDDKSSIDKALVAVFFFKHKEMH